MAALPLAVFVAEAVPVAAFFWFPLPLFELSSVLPLPRPALALLSVVFPVLFLSLLFKVVPLFKLLPELLRELLVPVPDVFDPVLLREPLLADRRLEVDRPLPEVLPEERLLLFKVDFGAVVGAGVVFGVCVGSAFDSDFLFVLLSLKEESLLSVFFKVLQSSFKNTGWVPVPFEIESMIGTNT